MSWFDRWPQYAKPQLQREGFVGKDNCAPCGMTPTDPLTTCERATRDPDPQRVH